MILLLSIQVAYGQNQAGFENYYYTGSGASAAIVPRVYYQDRRGWYGEARYNYEKAGAYAVYAGHSFSEEKDLSYSFTPMAGIVAGSFRGGSLALNMETDVKGISFSSSLQYTVSAMRADGNFFYSWSELGYHVTGRFYAGIALQQTAFCKAGSDWEPGVQLSLTWRKWRFPVYLFDDRHQNKMVVLGIGRDWTDKK